MVRHAVVGPSLLSGFLHAIPLTPNLANPHTQTNHSDALVQLPAILTSFATNLATPELSLCQTNALSACGVASRNQHETGANGGRKHLGDGA